MWNLYIYTMVNEIFFCVKLIIQMVSEIYFSYFVLERQSTLFRGRFAGYRLQLQQTQSEVLAKKIRYFVFSIEGQKDKIRIEFVFCWEMK